jgi:hypothetical protein
MGPEAMTALDEFLQRISDCSSGYHVSETSWDSRRSCVIQLLNAAMAEDALIRLREVFPDLWSRRDAVDLPPDIAQVVIGYGGFRDGQFIAASHELDGIRAWVWWAPWSDDVTVSIRLGLLGDVTSSHLLALKNTLVP